MSKAFRLGDVLTITTGRLVARDGMDAVYNILNYMTGDHLYTHQLPRASDECKPYLLRQFPQLAEIKPPIKFTDVDHVFAWLTEQEVKYGDSFDVEPIPQDDHTFKNPVTEAVEMVGADRVIVFDPKQEPD